MENSLAEKPIIVGLASIWAGGGHNALRDILAEELSQHKDFECHSFTHSDSSYDWFNDNIFGKAPIFLNFLYKKTPGEYPGVSAMKLVRECEEFINKIKPDIVISTNFGVCSAFGFLKRTLKLSFQNIYAIPDYGRTGAAAFPNNRYFKPDYVIVFDVETKKGLVEDLKFPSNKIILSGSIASRSFRDIIKDSKKLTRTELFKQINKELKFKWEIPSDKNTYIICGGAGGVINKSFKLLKAFAEYNEKNSAFQNENQFLIITGQNEKFRDKLNALRKKKNWQNIYPLPWISLNTYAKAMLASNFPILITIAPATINQLLTANCGPFVVYHYRTGPELENVAFIKKEGLGAEIKDPETIIHKIIKGFSVDERNDFLKLATEHLQLRKELLEELPAVLKTIYNANLNKKEINPKAIPSLDYTKISPKLLFSILILLIPSSLIFAYAQYFKGKKKIANNEYIKKATQLTGKFWPFK